MHASADFSVYEGTEHHSAHVAEATHHLIDKSHREEIEVYSGKYFPGLVLCGPGLLTKSHILIFLEPPIMAPSAGDQTFKTYVYGRHFIHSSSHLPWIVFWTTVLRKAMLDNWKRGGALRCSPWSNSVYLMLLPRRFHPLESG